MPNATDANQAEIVKALRSIGAGVVDLHDVGHGVPDLLVAYHGETVLMEVKTPTGRLRKLQREFRAIWPGRVYLVRSIDEALEAIGARVMGTTRVREVN
jgi:hypothetical protein